MSREHPQERASNIGLSQVVLSWDTFLMLLIFAAIAAALLPLINDLYIEVINAPELPINLLALIIGFALSFGMRYYKLNLRRSIENDE